MIHISLKRPEKRKEIENICKKNQWQYKSYKYGMMNSNVLELKTGDIIIGYLSQQQQFLPLVDVELWNFTNQKNVFQKYLLTEVELDKPRPCVIDLGVGGF